METLALSHRPVPSGLPLIPSDYSITPTSFSLFNTLTSRIRSLKCSALSPPSLVDHLAKFNEAAKHGNLIPLYRSIFSNHLTPVLAYRCLVKEDDRDTPSFFFESVEPGLKASSVCKSLINKIFHQNEYSVIGALPTMEFVAKENMVTVMDPQEGWRTEELVEDPMDVPRRIMGKWKPQRIDELPEAFCGGWVGYFSYDTVRYVEKKKLPFSNAPEDDRSLPDVHLGLYDDVIVFDRVDKKAYVIHWVRSDRFPFVEEAFIDEMNSPRLAAGSIKLCTGLFGPLKKSTVTNEAYKKAVMQAKEHILAGDIFQIVLSQRFERRTFVDPFEVYRALRIVNPSPYMTYLQVSKPGSINVEKLMNIERYSHVMHISSTVTGELLDDLTSWDALRAALPVGTVSGAPKVKAMELIDQLEVTRCGPYSGRFGGISFYGDMDIALALRTIVFPTGMLYDTMYSYKDANNCRDWVAHLQAGAGIVADSDPGDEQRECENKAAALARAIDLAESSFIEK